MNIHKIVRQNTPDTLKPRGELQETPKYLAEKKLEGHTWVVEDILDNEVTGEENVLLKVNWEGDYVQRWE